MTLLKNPNDPCGGYDPQVRTAALEGFDYQHGMSHWFQGTSFVPTYKPLLSSLDRDPIWKVSFLISLASAKGVNVVHGLSNLVLHSEGWKSCTLIVILDFSAQAQNPIVSDLKFSVFSIPSLCDFIGNEEGKMLLFSLRVPRCFIRRRRQYRFDCKNLCLHGKGQGECF